MTIISCRLKCTCWTSAQLTTEYLPTIMEVYFWAGSNGHLPLPSSVLCCRVKLLIDYEYKKESNKLFKLMKQNKFHQMLKIHTYKVITSWLKCKSPTHIESFIIIFVQDSYVVQAFSLQKNNKCIQLSVNC